MIELPFLMEHLFEITILTTISWVMVTSFMCVFIRPKDNQSHKGAMVCVAGVWVILFAVLTLITYESEKLKYDIAALKRNCGENKGTVSVKGGVILCTYNITGNLSNTPE